MVPFPAALCAAGTPMGWTLVAPFLELPPSCAALAALSNRARPAVRCRTALPQKRRDCGGPGGAFHLPVGHLAFTPPGAFSLGPLQRHRLGRRSRHGPSGPRRKCGVRRREPLCGAIGVYQINGAPAALCAVGNKREWGAGSTSPWGRNVCALRAHSKARAALRQNRVRLRRETKKKAPRGALLHPTAHSAVGPLLIE